MASSSNMFKTGRNRRGSKQDGKEKEGILAERCRKPDDRSDNYYSLFIPNRIGLKRKKRCNGAFEAIFLSNAVVSDGQEGEGRKKTDSNGTGLSPCISLRVTLAVPGEGKKRKKKGRTSE